MRVPLSQSLAKTGTFAVVHFAVAFTVAYLLHERIWARFTPRAAGPAMPVPQRSAETSC